MKITNRQIREAARKIWGRHYADEREAGRETIRRVLTVLRVPHEKLKRR